MINNYFLLPSDIKVADKSNLENNKILLRYNNNLNFSLVYLCVFDSKKKVKFLEKIDLLDNNKKLKNLKLK